MDIRETIDYVKKNMLGRIADEQDNTLLMAETTLCDGDHLEIGTLHGGSVIVVALLKKEHGYKGSVYCIDPLNGYYKDAKFGKDIDPITKVPISIATVQENEKRFGINLNIVKAKSIPFPINGHTFSTAYIDGDHWGDIPWQDFINVSECTTKFITFDNCDSNHKDVMTACKYAEHKWIPYVRKGITCIVRHP